MSTHLDLDDVCADNPLAKEELDTLRAEIEGLRVEISKLQFDISCHTNKIISLQNLINSIDPAAVAKALNADL